MTRKTRQWLFWLSVSIFAIVAPPLLLYARGYRFDMARRRFVPTGALFIKSEPPGAAIIVNGERKGETAGALKDAISKPGFIANLLPREYDVRVEKPGYIPWVKKLLVLPRQVTEARSVVLFAERRKPETIFFSAITGALVVPEKHEVLVSHESSATSWIVEVAQHSRDQKTLYTLRKPLTQKSSTLLPATPEPYLRVWARSPSDRWVLFEQKENTKEKNLIMLDRQKTGIASLQRLSAYGDILHAAFLNNDTALFLAKDHVVYAWNVSENSAVHAITSSSLGFAVFKKKVYVVGGSPPLLYAYAENLHDREQISTMPIGHGMGNVSLVAESLPEGRLALLIVPQEAQEGTVSIVESDHSLKELRGGIRSMQLAPDGKRLLMRTQRELWVHFFEDVLTQPVHRAGEDVLVARFGTDVRDAWWYPAGSDELLYVLPEGLFAMELDDRGGNHNNIDLVRNGTIAIQDVTREGIYFTAQKRLAYMPWEPAKE